MGKKTCMYLKKEAEGIYYCTEYRKRCLSVEELCKDCELKGE